MTSLRIHRSLVGAVLALSAGASFLAAQSPPAAAGSAGISGRVLAAATSKPIMGALVTVTAPELPGGRTVLTDERGFYRLGDLPAGRYTIVGFKPGYLDLVYGQRRPLMDGEIIELDKGEQYPNTDCMLLKAGAIGGRIVDENGDPIGAASLELLQIPEPGGQARTTAVASTLTDDQGVYRFWGLLPGTYVVRAAPPTLGSTRQVLDAAFFPGVRAFEQARPIRIGISQETTNADIELPAAAGGR